MELNISLRAGLEPSFVAGLIQFDLKFGQIFLAEIFGFVYLSGVEEANGRGVSRTNNGIIFASTSFGLPHRCVFLQGSVGVIMVMTVL